MLAPMRVTKHILPILVALLLIVVIFSSGFYVGRTQLLRTENNLIVTEGIRGPADVDLALFWDVWRELDERFVGVDEEKPSYEDRLWGAIQGLTESYGDPYTVFLTPAEATLFEEDILGNFGGVGMEVGIENDVLTVIAPLRGTPADHAGILAGDVVTAIDGTSTLGMSIDEAVFQIRGEVGTPVILTILRKGKRDIFDLEVVRGVINIPTIATELRPDGIFVISLFNFSASSPKKASHLIHIKIKLNFAAKIFKSVGKANYIT